MCQKSANIKLKNDELCLIECCMKLNILWETYSFTLANKSCFIFSVTENSFEK